MTINIAGLRKADVLCALYNHVEFGANISKPINKAHIFLGAIFKEKATPEAAIKYLESFQCDGLNFDYVDLGPVFGGPRPIKANLSGDSFDSSLYDRDHGKGMARKAINDLRQQYALQKAGCPFKFDSYLYMLAKCKHMAGSGFDEKHKASGASFDACLHFISKCKGMVGSEFGEKDKVDKAAAFSGACKTMPKP